MRERTRQKEKLWEKVIYTPFSHDGTKDEQMGLAVGCSWRRIRCSPAFTRLTNESSFGGNLTPSLLLKWFSPCPADEGLTSSVTMVEWGKRTGLPSTQWQAHYGVWPRGHGPEWEEPQAGVRWQGRARVTSESPWERPPWPSCTQVGHLLTRPFVQWKPGLLNISQSYFLALSM